MTKPERATICSTPYQGREVSFFTVMQPEGMHVYTASDFEAAKNVSQRLYDKNVTIRVSTRNALSKHIEFKKLGETLLFLGSSASETTLFPLRLEYLLERDKIYHPELYHS